MATTHEHDHGVSAAPTTSVVGAAPATAVVAETRATADDPYAARRGAATKMMQAVYLVFGTIEALIAIRLVLKLLGANDQADFAAFIYRVTAPLVAPFVGLFGTPQAAASVLEPHAIVALVVYALLAWLVAKALWLVFGETRSATTSTASAVRTQVE